MAILGNTTINGDARVTGKIYAPGGVDGNASSASSVAWNNVTGKPSTYAPSTHTHDYLPLTGGTITGTLNYNTENNIAWNYRPGHSGYYCTASYQTSGNEALVFASKNSVTSFMFVNGEDSITNHAASRWTELTPGLQIKQNNVSIGRLIPNGTTASYKLDVNGATNISGDLTVTSINGVTVGTPKFTDTTYSAATTSAAGLMSAADKTKLDGIATSANNYSHPNTVTAGTVGTSSATSGSTLAVPYITYNANGHITATGTHTHTVSGFLPLAGGDMTGNIKWAGSTREILSFAPTDNTWRGGLKYSWSGNTTVALWSKNSKAQFVWHAGTDFSTADVNGTATRTYDFQVGRVNGTGALQALVGGTAVSLEGHTHSAATTSAAGLMSAADKTKLDGIATSANNYSHPTTSGNKHIPSGGSSGQFLKWSADGTATWAADNNTTYSAGKSMTLSGTTFDCGKRWNAVTQGQKWSRIMLVTPDVTTEGTSGILSVSCTRGSVVCNASFYITSSHAGSNLVIINQISANNYSPFGIRGVGSTNGTYYLELLDTANNIASGTAQTWHCTYIPILNSTVTIYTAFTDGTTIPSGYAAYGQVTTVTNSNALPIRNISRSGTTFTATRTDGSTFTFTQQDNNTTYSAATQSAAGLMSAADKTKLDGIATGANNYSHPNTVTAGTVGTSSATSGSTLAVPYVTYNANGHITATGTHTHTITGFLGSSATAADSSKLGGVAAAKWVPKRDNGYSYNNLANYYSGGTTYKYIRITVPTESATWAMISLEVSIKQQYGSGKFGKLLIYGYWSSSAEWSAFNATILGNLHPDTAVYGSDKTYIYIYCNCNYITCTVDKMTVGDNITGKDISAVTIDGVNELPTTYQTATMYRYAASDTVNGAASSAVNVTGTVAIANGGTGATTRLNAVKALTNEDVGTNATYFLTITNSWGKAGYTSVANAKTVLGLKSAAYTESSAYATSGHNHDSTYLKLSGGTMTGVINTPVNAVGINFRNGDAYHCTTSYQTTGNEALVFATKYSVASFMFVHGEDSVANHDSNRWQSLTPTLQMKSGCVSIGKLIGNNVTPSYKLDVNGTANFSDNVTVTKINNVSVGTSPKFTDTVYTHPSDGGNTGSFGPSANASPAHGGTFSVPYITVNAAGHVTAASTKTITLPADNNTDTKVTSTATNPSSTATWYPIASSSSSTETNTTVKSSGIKYQLLYGTTSAEGTSELQLGNTTATGTAGNMSGAVILYNDKGKYASINPHAGDTSNRKIYTPKSGGTLIVHTTDTAIGSSKKPVYITADGVASTIGYTIEKDVPSNAVFTDTNNAVTNTLGTTTKFYITGTTSATTATGGQYFDTGIYSTTTAGYLHVTGLELNSGITIY